MRRVEAMSRRAPSRVEVLRDQLMRGELAARHRVAHLRDRRLDDTKRRRWRGPWRLPVPGQDDGERNGDR